MSQPRPEAESAASTSSSSAGSSTSNSQSLDIGPAPAKMTKVASKWQDKIYFSTFIAEHNIPFFSDHLNKLCKVMFPDSNCSSGRTKTTAAIVKYAQSPALNDEVIKSCCSSSFTV